MRQDSSDDRRRRVGDRARHLWIEAGSPDPGPDAYRDLASELIAIEDSQALTLKAIGGEGPYGEPIEEAEAVENLGEFPTTTDEGEQTYPPKLPNGRPN